MNDYFHNPEIEFELEARIAAWVLGEASDFEADQLQRLIDVRPELAALKSQFEAVHELLRDMGTGETVDDAWQLPPEKRSQLLAVLNGDSMHANLKTQIESPLTVKRNALMRFSKVAAIFCAAGCLGILALLSSFFLLNEKEILATSAVESRLAADAMEEMPSEGYFVPPKLSWKFESAADNKAVDLYADKAGTSSAVLPAMRESLGFDAALSSPNNVTDDVQKFPSAGVGVDAQLEYLKRLRETPAKGTEVAANSDELRGLVQQFEMLNTEAKSQSFEATSAFAAMESAVRQDSATREESPGRGRSKAKQDSADEWSSLGRQQPDQQANADLNFRYLADPQAALAAGSDSGMDGTNLGKLEGSFFGLGGYGGRDNSPTDAREFGRAAQPDFKESQEVDGDGWFGSYLPKSPEPPIVAGGTDGKANGIEDSVAQDLERESMLGEPFGDVEFDLAEGRVALEPAASDLDAIAGMQAGLGTRLSLSDLGGEARNQAEKSLAEKNRALGLSVGAIEKKEGQSQQAKREASRVPQTLNETNTSEEAFSTFSLHVSDVSFKLAQAALAVGKWPEAAKIRIEEFVNAFDYGDPLPSQHEKIACVVEQAIHPFLQQRNVLRVSLRTAATGRATSTPLRLTFLLDNSGSMERSDRQQTVRRAFALLARQLTESDQVTLISFARLPRLLADGVRGDQSQQLVELIDDLPSEGGTNMEAALQLAFEKAREQQVAGAQSRIVLLTDGAVNLGDANPESLSNLIATIRDSGIAFDAAGISAEGLNDEILEALTRQGDGRYYLLDASEVVDEGFASQIAGALRPSAKNVKVQIEFNPQRVGRYKLLGFEQHLLKQEDFRNDSVDAAELAAAEAGVAVYQFEAKPGGEGDVGSVSVRFRDLSTGQMLENRWPIPYEADALRLERAAPSLQVATAAALLAAKLRGDALGETVELKLLSELLSSLPERVRRATHVEQLQRMIQQARQLSGS